jgi:hypothetical protein
MNMLTLFGISAQPVSLAELLLIVAGTAMVISAQPVSLAELLLIVAGTAMVIGVIAFLVIF